MNTPDANRYQDWWEREGCYLEEQKRSHPCYNCKHFERCWIDNPTDDFNVCEDYEEE